MHKFVKPFSAVGNEFNSDAIEILDAKGYYLTECRTNQQAELLLEAVNGGPNKVPVYLSDLDACQQQQWVSVFQHDPEVWEAYRDGKNIIVGYYMIGNAQVEKDE